MNSRFFITTLALALLGLAGCKTAAKTERSAAITATGEASIENRRQTNQSLIYSDYIFAVKIDGQLLQTRGKKGVYPLTPGPHEIDVMCHFGRMALGSPLIIDMGQVLIHFEAKAGIRYRLTGKKHSHTSAELWIEDVKNGTAVTPRLPVALLANPQHVPVFIQMP